ncbi:MAG: 2,3-diphosphoglycerate-dependent phosphoglycerate mutase [Bacilli bacterium]|nr:2,3-diphosphoglycerate-dependent phosphoglycerate mutase [Bacilli bacterium]
MNKEIYKVVFVRHGESKWNQLNLFTGWADVDLSEKGIQEANNCGNIIKKNGFDFDLCYTSYLKRAIRTLNSILSVIDSEWIPVIKTWRLNERHYGALQGLNKKETSLKYGEKQVEIWRRSYSVIPPKLEENDPRSPKHDKKYLNLSNEELPLSESLEDTEKRVIPFWNNEIKQKIQEGKRVLIVAHGNSLRSLIKFLNNLNSEEIFKINIPTGKPFVYEFDKNFNVINKYFL